MKRINISFAFLGLLGLMAFSYRSDNPTLKIGDSIPMADVKMESTKHHQVSLQDAQGANGLLVIFSCNTCPFVLAWEDRYNGLFNEAKKHKIGMILANSNEGRRTGDDNLEAMKQHAHDKGFHMPYVVDTNHKLADAFGAKTTPHVYLFNKEGKLAYVGAIDDNSKDKSEVTAPYLSNAIRELGNGSSTCSVAETKAVGCSIKRIKK